MPATRRGRRTKSKPLPTSITIRLTDDLDRRIARLAERQKRTSYSEMVRVVLEAGLDALEAAPAS